LVPLGIIGCERLREVRPRTDVIALDKTADANDAIDLRHLARRAEAGKPRPITEPLRFNSASARWITSAARATRSAFVLVRDRIAEQGHQPVAQLLGDVAAHLRHCRRGGVEISADEIAPFLGIELRGMPVEPTRSQNITVR
jgi:hypothetical protein